MKKATPMHGLSETLTLTDLCRFCEAEESWIIELVQQGVLRPRGTSADTWQFHARSIARAKKASRLAREKGLNAVGVAMVLDLLEEREQMLRLIARADMV